MALNRNYNYQYYRPQQTSVSTTRNRANSSPQVSRFHMMLYFFIGFIFTYIGLSFSLSQYYQATESVVSASTAPAINLVQQNNKQSENQGILAQFQPAQTPAAQTLGLSIKQDEELLKLIQAKIPNDNGEYAVIVKSLDTTEHLAYLNHEAIFPAGSLYKLYLMAAALEKIEKGELSLETTVSAKANHLEEVLGGADFGYENRRGETISYTIEEILGRIARISDNYASIMLAEKLDWDFVRDYARRIGASSTTIKSPISTNANDTAHFFELLYQKKIVSEQASDKIIDLLKTAQLNQRIPAKLPKGKLKIAHKTGELPGVRHDAGIVFLDKTDTNKGPYLIVLMSKDLKGEDGGVAALAEISKVVYDYMNDNTK